MRRLAVAVLLVGLLAATASAAPAPTTFVWPTSVEAEPDGSLLLVENGLQRVLRVDPRTGTSNVVTGGFSKIVAATQTPRGIVVGDNTTLRLVGHGVLTRVSSQISFLAKVRGGVAFTTDTAAFALVGTKLHRLVKGLAGPHGIAIAHDGSVLVADTGHGKVLAIRDGRARVFAWLPAPRGIAVERSGRVDIIAPPRIVRFSASGKRLGTFGPAFSDPYQLTVAGDGTLYVVETAQAGWLVRVDPQGRIATVPTG